MKPDIHCITLPVDDLAKSVSFYKDGLGLDAPDSADDDHVAFILPGELYLVLITRAEFAEYAGRVGASTAAKGQSECIVSVFPDDKGEVDALIAKAQAAGAKVSAPKDDDGSYAGYFVDPDGHIWEVLYDAS